MKDLFYKQLIKLLDIKSIISIIVTIVFAILSLEKVFTSAEVLTVISIVITNYFAYQHGKNNNNKGDKE